MPQNTNTMIEQAFILDGWRVEVAGGQISRNQQTIHLEPQIMKALAVLANNHNEVVSKDRLIAAVWGHSSVSDAALTRCIFEIRRAFGDNARESKIIETVPKVGYRLVARLQAPQEKPRLGPPVMLWSAAAIITLVVFLSWGVQTNEVKVPDTDEPQVLSQSERAYDAYQKGVAHYEKYAYLHNENAIALFEKALEYDPFFGLAYARLADSLTQQIRYWGGDRLADARAAANRALELAPSQPQSHNAYGSVLELSGETGEALGAFRRAYTLDPTHWQSAYNAASLHKRRLEFRQAELLFLQGLEHSPNPVIAMGHLGFLYLRMEEVDNAKRWLNRALEAAPMEAYAWSQMAMLEMVAGDTSNAIANCQRVRKFFPDHRGCLYVLGVSNLLDGNMAEARAWFDYVISNLPDSGYAELGKAQILIAEGKNEQGLEIVDQVLEDMYRDIPGSDSPWGEYWIIAGCYALKGDKSNAFVWLDKAAVGGRRFSLWDSKDPVFGALRGDQRFDRYIAMTKSVNPFPSN